MQFASPIWLEVAYIWLDNDLFFPPDWFYHLFFLFYIKAVFQTTNLREDYHAVPWLCNFYSLSMKADPGAKEIYMYIHAYIHIFIRSILVF